MNAFRLIAPICLIGVVVANSVHAGIIVFDDKSVFLSTSQATSATGALPNPGAVTSPVTIGDLTFSPGAPATQLFIGTSGGTPAVGNDWSARLPGNEIAIAGPEHLNIGISGPVLAFGFDFVEPENDPNTAAGFIDSTFSVSLFSSGLQVDSFSYSRPNDTASFVGVISDTSFDRVEIFESIGDTENEFFGEFYTAAVPEPSSVFVLILGLGVCTTRRRTRNLPV